MTADNRILQFFPQRLRGDWERGSVNFEKIQEIRLRVNQPVRVLTEREHRLPIIYGERELEEIFRYLCHDSVYAYEEEAGIYHCRGGTQNRYHGRTYNSGKRAVYRKVYSLYEYQTGA